MWLKRREDSMRIGLTLKKAIVLFAILLVYIVSLVLGGTEVRRRSLQLTGESTSPDHVSVVIVVTGVNQLAQELTAQLSFRPAGGLALDPVTPAADLKLLVNNVGAEQEFTFERGRRMNPVEVVFPLNGNLNRYPFDRYRTTLSLLMVRPEANGEAPTSEDSRKVENGRGGRETPFGAVAVEKTLPVPLSVSLLAAIPGMKFSGRIDRTESVQLKAIDLNVRRTNNVIMVSILISATMIGFAVSLLFIVLHLVGSSWQESSLVPLSLSVALIFGLPALRNAQPGVPPIGAFCDFISFIWAELIVAVSGLMFAWRWLRAAKRGSF
jgi:hypothetical protein